MADVIFIAITIVFFVICVFYVQWCDRIIGPDDFETAKPVGDQFDNANEVESVGALDEATA